MRSTQASQEPTSPPIHLTFHIKNPPRFFFIAALILLTLILVRNLWVSDDAFITLRTVDNLLHGHGLVWNVGERVQAFTHPLWMFILAAFKWLFHDPLYAFYVPSFLLSFAVIFLFLKRFAQATRPLVLATLALAGSMAFIDYSSSGLENPLTHLFIVLMLLVLHRDDLPPLRRLLLISLLAGLASFNRLDTFVIFAPALGYQFWRCRGEFRKALGIVLLGLLPLILWEAFATFYYGFPFPNTFYTKAATGLGIHQLFSQGWIYVANSFHLDPLTLGTVILGLLSVAFQRDERRLTIAAGIVLYILYVLWIGGDFMSGRYFSGIFLLGLVLLLTFDISLTFGPVPSKVYGLALTVVLLVGLSAERPPALMQPEQPGVADDRYGIALEKYFYFRDTSFINHFRYPLVINTAIEGQNAREAGLSPVEMNVIGIFGYFAGPDIYIIDSYALTDPLRAHLPADGTGRIGHYERRQPAGYLETIESGFRQNRIEDPNLQLYYEKLTILTRGDLLAPGRLAEIIKFNLGGYDHLIESYLFSLPRP